MYLFESAYGIWKNWGNWSVRVIINNIDLVGK